VLGAVVLLGPVVLSVVGELPPVDTLGDAELPHAAPSMASANTHAASPARRRRLRRRGEWGGFKVVEMRFVITTTTDGSSDWIQIR